MKQSQESLAPWCSLLYEQDIMRYLLNLLNLGKMASKILNLCV